MLTGLLEPFGLRFEEEDPDALFAGFRFSEVYWDRFDASGDGRVTPKRVS